MHEREEAFGPALVVFDPSNYSQNALTAARTLEQQVKQLYPQQYAASVSGDQMVQDARARWDVPANSESVPGQRSQPCSARTNCRKSNALCSPCTAPV
ncbi:MAG: hypothetical protein J0I83_14230 [Nitrobacter sp.]|nr:hypothetical protein [Nitrobacter sp.]OJV01563.1 MAG: hypothetical protein BGO16_17025 [Nitrobacter sp. 62-23]